MSWPNNPTQRHVHHARSIQASTVDQNALHGEATIGNHISVSHGNNRNTLQSSTRIHSTTLISTLRRFLPHPQRGGSRRHRERTFLHVRIRSQRLVHHEEETSLHRQRHQDHLRGLVDPCPVSPQRVHRRNQRSAGTQ